VKYRLPSCAFVLTAFIAAFAQADVSTLSLMSPDFGPQGSVPLTHVFNDYGCTGQNRSPALSWRGAPAGTKSFAITMFDLDEHGSPSGWWHWVVYNLPATTSGLPENAGSKQDHKLPAGALQGRTDLGNVAYDGPCPDKGQSPHRYLVTLYALSIDKLPVPPEASGAMVTWTAHDYTLAKSTLVARYGR
jgi:Raf kinase inhibitor-like YbhB/YbcL family protein